ncbi:MAG: DUF1579 family protein [Planctomycetota bacterium]
MNFKLVVLLGAVLAAGILLGTASSQDSPTKPAGGDASATGEDYSPIDMSKIDMQKMMEAYFAVGKLGKFHKRLEYFLGKWDTETQISMPGAPPMPATKGTAEYTWLLEGRWLQGRSVGTMMGRPAEYVSILGYDNHRKKYMSARFSSLDTSLTTSTGAISRDGSIIDLYFQLDEPGTGEIAKNARSSYRIIDANKFVVDVYDLAMAGMDNKVLTFTYTRSK